MELISAASALVDDIIDHAKLIGDQLSGENDEVDESTT